MKRISLRILALAVGVGLVAGLTGCCSLVKSCLHQVIIVKQPESRAVLTNADVTFSVLALGGPPFTTNGLSYQWEFNGTILSNSAYWVTIPGATNHSITINDVQTNNVGFYRVLVSGSTTVISDAASLQVLTTSGSGSITVYGTPVASNGKKGTCPGSFAGYVKYLNSPPTLWGWAVVNPSVAASGTNGGNGPNPRVEYLGYYGDTGCAASSVSTSPHPLSPRYVFTIYFNAPVPTGSYPIILGNLQ